MRRAPHQRAAQQSRRRCRCMETPGRDIAAERHRNIRECGPQLRMAGVDPGVDHGDGDVGAVAKAYGPAGAAIISRFLLSMFVSSFLFYLSEIMRAQAPTWASAQVHPSPFSTPGIDAQPPELLNADRMISSARRQYRPDLHGTAIRARCCARAVMGASPQPDPGDSAIGARRRRWTVHLTGI